MGERKVLNNYIPPDFDPSILPKFKRNRDKKIEVRMMLPFSMRCNTCGEYMYMGKKFNSKSEIVKGEDYMGIRKFRFYIKCCVCSAEITFKTDPQNSGYTCESGASRNFEMWRETETVTEEAKRAREAEDDADAMKALENRTMDSKIEMDVLDALDEIKAINQRHERIDTNKLISSLHTKAAAAAEAAAASSTAVDSKHVVNKTTGLTLADEELVKSIKFGKGPSIAEASASDVPSSSSGGSGGAASDFLSVLNKQIQTARPMTAATSAPLATTIVRKKRKIEDTTAQSVPVPVPVAVTPASILPITAVTTPAIAVAAPTGLMSGLLGGYGSSDNEEED